MRRGGRHNAVRADQKGMTLIEVLVAFAILAGITISVLGLVGQNARYMATAEERLLATIAVDNLMTEVLAKRETPRAGRRDVAVSLAERDFVASRRVVELLDGRAVLVEFEMRRDGDSRVLARASALKEAR